MLKKEPKHRLMQNARRVQHIVGVLARYGLTDWLRTIKIDVHFPLVRRLLYRGTATHVPPSGATRWQLLRMAVEELGPTFIKFGQIMSARADLLPIELIRELSGLQDRVQPVPFTDAKRVIEEDQCAGLSTIYGEFNEIPVASASIAQVYRARTIDGLDVAVKVQRPGIRQLIDVDLDIMQVLAELTERYIHEFRHFQLPGMVAEFRMQIRKELDFRMELHSLEKFATQNAKDPRVYVPKAYRRLSSERVLVMEYVTGVRLTDAINGSDQSLDLRTVAQNGANLLLEQVFINGFFHADPHPGNIVVLPNDVICFLDFGMMGIVRPQEQRTMVEIVVGVLMGDIDQICSGLLALLKQPDTPYRVELEDRLAELMERYLDLPVGSIDVAKAFDDIVETVVQFALTLPPRFLLIGKTIVTIEGLGTRLVPDFDLFTVVKPFADRLMRQIISPQRLRNRVVTAGINYTNFVEEWPRDAGELLKIVKSGRLGVRFRLDGIEPLRQTIDSVADRLIYGIVLASIMISSALIVRADIPPIVFGVPIIGLTGFGIAGVMSVSYLISMMGKLFRRRR